MSKKRVVKSKSARGIRSLPTKTPSAKQSRDVKGGSFLAGFKAGATTQQSTGTTSFRYHIPAQKEP